MANKKTTALTELNEAPNDSDIIPIVDVSDTTDSANGTTKKITAANLKTGLLTASSTATLTNKTIDANGTGNSISNIEVADMAASAIVTESEGIASNDNDTTIPTSAAVKAYADAATSGTAAINDITDITITTPADNEVLAYDNGTSTWINQTPAEAGLQPAPSEGAFANGDKTKLDGIETGADVTDTANVTSAGALMDSEVSDLAGIKALDTSTLQVKPTEGAFVDGDKTKLDGIEASADVTDETNVKSALDGATITTATVATDDKVLIQDTNDSNNLKTVTAQAIADLGGGGTVDVVSNVATSTVLGRVTAGSGDSEELTATQVRTLINVEDGADVTDSTNVTTALSSITIDALSGVDTDKSKTPADGDVLTFDGTDWNAETPAGGGGQSPYTYIIGSGGDYATLNAYAAATPANGDVLFIKGDHTLTASVTISVDDLTIIGDGKNNSTIDLATNGAELLLNGSRPTVKDVGFDTGATSGASLYVFGSEALVDGIKLTTSSTFGREFRTNGTYTRVQNCEFISTNTGGSAGNHFIHFNGAYSMFMNNIVRANTTSTSTNSATFGSLSTSQTITGNTFLITNCTNFDDVFYYANGSNSVITGNKFHNIDNTKRPVCISVNGIGSTVTGNNISGNGNGVVVTANDVVISGNYMFDGSATATEGIAVTADDTVITGNRITGHATGILINNAAYDRTLIMGNNISCTTDITDSGTGTLKVTATDSDALNIT